MLPPAPTRNQILRQLDEALRTDADLYIFCLDYFSEAHRLFALGMERNEKVTLLVSAKELTDVWAKLHERISQRGLPYRGPVSCWSRWQ